MILIGANWVDTADVALGQKLGEELKYEKEAAPAGEPEFLTAFKAHGVWKVRAFSFACIGGELILIYFCLFFACVWCTDRLTTSRGTTRLR